ncbi:hypothetical protein, partial [Pseudomonas viridiflava]|uniref:hypothetical protein n=1 Tax=Pseudomonas viridiflava TaxID=33069 RepID=UPI001F3DE6C0
TGSRLTAQFRARHSFTHSISSTVERKRTPSNLSSFDPVQFVSRALTRTFLGREIVARLKRANSMDGE